MTKYAFLVILLVAAVSAQDKKCMTCHSDETATGKFADGSEVSIYIDQTSYKQSAHGDKMSCTKCHPYVDISDHPNRELGNRHAYTVDLSKSCTECHGQDMKQDVHSFGNAAACADCHNPHYVVSFASSRPEVARTCAKCHKATFEKYAHSVHGNAMMREQNPDVPGCSDCHPAHATKKASDMTFHLSSVDICAKCHGDAEKMKRYGVSSDVTQTYFEDFHGVSVAYQRKEGKVESFKPTCIECHGAHEIGKLDAANSIKIKGNLAKVCARCHPGATPQFSNAWLSHYVPSPSKAPLVYFVKLFYWVFIPFMIVGLLIQIALDLIHVVISRNGSGESLDSSPMVPRFSLLQRFEHFSVMVVFVVLAVTGIPQKFHESAWAEWLIMNLGGIETVRAIHRAAGIAFAAIAFGALFYDVVRLLGGKIMAAMVPTAKDFRDAILEIRYFLGLSMERPKFDRYDYRQKFEYWGLLFGGMVMVATGFVLYFPMTFASLLPGELIPVAKVAHSNEAMLALLVVITWHLYCAHLKPEYFPFDGSIFTGKISSKRMQEEHPLEWERQGN